MRHCSKLHKFVEIVFFNPPKSSFSKGGLAPLFEKERLGEIS